VGTSSNPARKRQRPFGSLAPRPAAAVWSESVEHVVPESDEQELHEISGYRSGAAVSPPASSNYVADRLGAAVADVVPAGEFDGAVRPTLMAAGAAVAKLALSVPAAIFVSESEGDQCKGSYPRDSSEDGGYSKNGAASDAGCCGGAVSQQADEVTGGGSRVGSCMLVSDRSEIDSCYSGRVGSRCCDGDGSRGSDSDSSSECIQLNPRWRPATGHRTGAGGAAFEVAATAAVVPIPAAAVAAAVNGGSESSTAAAAAAEWWTATGEMSARGAGGSNTAAVPSEGATVAVPPVSVLALPAVTVAVAVDRGCSGGRGGGHRATALNERVGGATAGGCGGGYPDNRRLKSSAACSGGGGGSSGGSGRDCARGSGGVIAIVSQTLPITGGVGPIPIRAPHYSSTFSSSSRDPAPPLMLPLPAPPPPCIAAATSPPSEGPLFSLSRAAAAASASSSGLRPDGIAGARGGIISSSDSNGGAGGGGNSDCNGSAGGGGGGSSRDRGVCSGGGRNYKFVEVVRGRAARDALPANDCEQCTKASVTAGPGIVPVTRLPGRKLACTHAY
jgi:hypothetical protein